MGVQTCAGAFTPYQRERAAQHHTRFSSNGGEALNGMGQRVVGTGSVRCKGASPHQYTPFRYVMGVNDNNNFKRNKEDADFGRLYKYHKKSQWKTE